MNIRSKLELFDLFADNNTGDISAADLRDFVLSNRVFARETVTTPIFNVPVEADVVTLRPGTTDVQLPPSAAYGERSLRLQNRTGGVVTVTPASGETISGNASINLENPMDAVLATEDDGWTGEVQPSIASMQGRAGEVLTVAPGETSPRWRNIWHVLAEAGPVPPP